MACFLLVIPMIAGGCVTETTTPKRSFDNVLDQSAPTGFGEAPPQSQRPPTRPPPAPPRSAQARTPTTAAAAASLNCQATLDEICTALLLHYKAYSRMPDTLAELKKFQEFKDISLVCPDSKQPYTYFPEGVRLPDEELIREGRATVKVFNYVIVTDPVPAHGGLRYAIFIVRPEGAADIQARVGILPDDLSP